MVMHVGWSADVRPGWRFRCEHELLMPSRQAPALLGRQLQSALAATGRVRGANVSLREGRLVVVMAVKAGDDVQASATGLAVVDMAVGRVGGIVLGALHAYEAARLRPGD